MPNWISTYVDVGTGPANRVTVFQKSSPASSMYRSGYLTISASVLTCPP
jgi:hypothetical protein